MAVGGDIEEISFNHPTLGTATFFPKSGEDSTFDEGGFRTSDDANMIAGGSEMIRQVNRVRWSLECPIAWDMNTRSDIKKLRDLAKDPVEATWTISHINGTVWSGKGVPVGDIQGNGNQATATLKIAGGGELVKIVG